MVCDKHESLEKKIDSLHQDLSEQNNKIFGLLESQIKQSNSTLNKTITWILSISGIILLGYYGLSKFIPTISKLL